MIRAIAVPTKVPTQEQRVYQYIKDFGSITRSEAFTDIGVANLTAIISKLRQHGKDIKTIDVHTKNRYGQKVTYAKYILGDNEDESIGD